MPFVAQSPEHLVETYIPAEFKGDRSKLATMLMYPWDQVLPNLESAVQKVEKVWKNLAETARTKFGPEIMKHRTFRIDQAIGIQRYLVAKVLSKKPMNQEGIVLVRVRIPEAEASFRYIGTLLPAQAEG